MRNLILGMRTVAESQIENGLFSHKSNEAVDYIGEDGGIDRWRAVDGDYKVISIKPFATTGFANTLFVIPVDSDGNHEVCNTASVGPGLFTLIFAHDNKPRHKVGDIIKRGDDIYFEGTAGRATGNHIHFELSSGYVTDKIKVPGVGWVNPNPIPPSENLFLLESYNTVRIDIGTKYKWVTDIFTNQISRLTGLHKIHTPKGGLNLRDSVMGRVLEVIPYNITQGFKEIHFIEGFQQDGYQWATATNENGLVMYFQLDLNYITLS